MVILAAGLVQAYVLYYAFNYGVLSGLMQWDDCAVFLRGLINLDFIAHLHSGYAMLRNIPNLNIHAPLSDVQTIAGLLLSGGREWGPFALNVLPIIVALCAILFVSGRLDDALMAALLIFVLLQPLTINSLTYIKSDWKGGVLIAAAVFLLNEAAERGSTRLKLAGAAILGFAITSKLTAFYLPVFAVAILAIFELYALRVRRAAWHGDASHDAERAVRPLYGRHDVRVLAQCVALAVLPFTLFFVVYAKPTIQYIRYDLAGTWDDGLTTLARAVYYSPLSADGAAAWGTLHVFFGLFAAACVAIAVARRSYRYLLSLMCVLVVALMFLAPLAVPKTSNITFSATLLGVVMGGTLIAICTFARALPRWGGVAALAVVVPLALHTQLPLSDSAYGPANGPAPAQLRELESTYQDIVSDFQTSASARPTVLVFYFDLFAPHLNLSILYFQRTGRLLSVARVDDLSNASALRARLARTEYALTFVPAAGQQFSRRMGRGNVHIPLSMRPSMADEFVAGQPRFELIRRVPSDDGEIRIYRNRGILTASNGATRGNVNARAGEHAVDLPRQQ